MKTRITASILLLVAIYSLIGCAGNYSKPQGQNINDAPDIPLCDCRPYPKPQPVVIAPVEPVNTGQDIWQFDNESYLNNAAVWAAFETYMQQTDAALKYWHKCVSACNVQYRAINEGSRTK